MTTVVGYLRSPRPADQPARPKTAFERAAAAHSLRLATVYIDEPAGPGSRGGRSGFTAALADVHEGRADGVLLLHPSHLCWNPDVRAALAFLVTEAGGQLIVGSPAGWREQYA